MRFSEIVVLILILSSHCHLFTLLNLPLPLCALIAIIVIWIVIHYLRLRIQGKALVLVLNHSLAIDVCGALMPTVLALIPVLAAPSPTPTQIICLLTLSTSIAIITSLSSAGKMLVNVVRFVLTFTCLSAPLVDPLTMLVWIPLISVLGIIMGADVIPYLLILRQYGIEDKRGVFVIGGAGLHDAIMLSYLMSRGITSLIYVIQSRL